MARSVSWRRTVSDACNWHQTEALNATIYILRSTGPTGFLLKEEGEQKNVKVFLGDPHTCTCSVFKKERDLCKHICWLLLKKFRLSQNDPLSWQLGLVNMEITEILRGRNTAPQREKRIKSPNPLEKANDGRNMVEQREIETEDVCPICQEEFLKKKEAVTFCKFGCGNNVHIKCMKVWAEHQQKSSESATIKCPMCREDFGPFNLLKTEMRNANAGNRQSQSLRMDVHVGMMCSNCSSAPITGKCYRCTTCSVYLMCQKCFNLPIHTNHSFEFRQKRNQRWRPALRALGSSLPLQLVQNLEQREIFNEDYDLLLQLDRNMNTELSTLTEESLFSLPLEKVRERGQLLAPGTQCRVCLRGFTVGQFVRTLPCKHKFHKDCIDNWLLHSHPTCPIDGILAISQTTSQHTTDANTSHSYYSRSSKPTASDSDAVNSNFNDISLSGSKILRKESENLQSVDSLLSQTESLLDESMPTTIPSTSTNNDLSVPSALTPGLIFQTLNRNSKINLPQIHASKILSNQRTDSLRGALSSSGRLRKRQAWSGGQDKRKENPQTIANNNFSDLFLGNDPRSQPPTNEVPNTELNESQHSSKSGFNTKPFTSFSNVYKKF